MDVRPAAHMYIHTLLRVGAAARRAHRHAPHATSPRAAAPADPVDRAASHRLGPAAMSAALQRVQERKQKLEEELKLVEKQVRRYPAPGRTCEISRRAGRPTQQGSGRFSDALVWRAQVYELESAYLTEHAQCGSVLKGFDSFLMSSKSGSNQKRSRTFKPEERLFSLSSVTGQIDAPDA
eukprot:scaffold2655_cov400-Prasinococcus_capsulatus_cf.AAC.2